MCKANESIITKVENLMELEKMAEELQEEIEALQDDMSFTHTFPAFPTKSIILGSAGCVRCSVAGLFLIHELLNTIKNTWFHVADTELAPAA
ncbi:MAG: hypothetical protein IKE24_00565 [Clostridia bacterium]|nr:hypothetical protein [Clostridia bacterium]